MKKSNLLIAILLLSIIFIFFLTFKVLPQEIENVRSENNIMFVYRVERHQVPVFKTRLDINSVIDAENMEEFVQFYNSFTRDSIISREIILNSIQHNVPLHISFSIAWKESHFTPGAISRVNRNGSRDWGLFQLNDSYRNWTREQFFDIRLNTREGISYYKWCLDQSGDIVSALKAYNAGITRVLNQSSIPSSTYRYVDEILEFESTLDKMWNDRFGSVINE